MRRAPHPAPHDPYWNHNTAYHPWILSQLRPGMRVLDVGCGDGLLAAKLAAAGCRPTGLEPDAAAFARAAARLGGVPAATVQMCDFLSFDAPAQSFDAVLFVASLHHMNARTALRKARTLLAPDGVLLVVGLTRPAGAPDWLTEAARVLPAAIGSHLHGERGGGEIGVPTAPATQTLDELRALSREQLPGAHLRRALYYRVLLSWQKRELP